MSFQVGWGTAKFKRFAFAFIVILIIMFCAWYFEWDFGNAWRFNW